MTDMELGWIIGILEGEGCFSVNGKGKSAVIRVVMTDKDVLDKFKLLTQTKGNVQPSRNRNQPHASKRYQVGVYGRQAVELMRLVSPYMCARRLKKITQILSYHTHV